MRRFLAILILFVVCSFVWAASISFPDGTQALNSSKWGVVKFQLDDTDTNTVSLTTDDIYGTIKRITIDSNGTETDWSISIKDDIGITIFEKEDCNSVEIPYGYAIQQSAADGNLYCGIPIMGALTLTVSDVNFSAEVQTLSVDGSATDGDFTLTYMGQTTNVLDYDANATIVQSALNDLSTVESGDITVTSDGDFSSGDSFVFTFLSSLGNVPMVVIDANLTGANATITQTTRGGSDLDLLDVTIYYFKDGE